MSFDLLVFLLNSVLLGVGLAMDAFSVSIANAISDPHMYPDRKRLIAGTFALFQFLMPVIGWFGVHSAVSRFTYLKRFIPWTAFFLLLYIGGKMVLEGLKGNEEEASGPFLSLRILFIQGVATSIDALSAGLTMSDYSMTAAFTASLIIAAVTYLICRVGLGIGRRFGMILAGRADIVGGLILIGIGIKCLILR